MKTYQKFIGLQKSRTKCKDFWILLAIVFLLNLIWEFSHYGLYIDLTGINPTLHLTRASFFDALIILGIFLIISLIKKNFSWIQNPPAWTYFFIIISSLIIAIIIEFINLNLGRWTYTDTMPTIFGVGLSPLIQLFTTGILALFLIKLFKIKNS